MGLRVHHRVPVVGLELWAAGAAKADGEGRRGPRGGGRVLISGQLRGAACVATGAPRGGGGGRLQRHLCCSLVREGVDAEGFVVDVRVLEVRNACLA